LKRENATGTIITLKKNKIPDAAELATLQVRAELNKLGEAPRAYLEKLGLESMSIDSENCGRLTIDQRFNRIQGARPNKPGFA